MPTLTGTSGADKLKGTGKDSYTLKGLAGDDQYSLRLFSATIYNQYGDPSEEVYRRDKVVEASGGGNDTVRLYNYYAPYEFTGITPFGIVTAAELSGVEHIIAQSAVRSGDAIRWMITAGREANRIEAPGSDDTLSGGAGDDTISAGGGRDKLSGGDGADILKGEAGDDTLLGGKGNDTCGGGSGNDALSGEDGADILKGEAGNDLLLGGQGNDMLDGGSGYDTASYASYRSGVTIKLSTGSNTAHDRLNSVESVIGSSRSDRIEGSAGANVLSGEGGRDKLSGNNGNDTLDGGSDNDVLSGGTGNDRLAGGRGNDDLNGGSGADTIIGGNGVDLLRGGSSGDRFVFEFSQRGVDVERVAGRDTIVDFQDKVDRIVVDSGARFGEDVSIEIEQYGKDTLVRFDASYLSNDTSSVLLKNFDDAKLTSADFLFI